MPRIPSPSRLWLILAALTAVAVIAWITLSRPAPSSPVSLLPVPEPGAHVLPNPIENKISATTINTQEPTKQDTTTNTKNREIPQPTWRLFTEDNLYRSITDILSQSKPPGWREASYILAYCNSLDRISRMRNPEKAFIPPPKTDAGRRARDQIMRRCGTLPKAANGSIADFFEDRIEPLRKTDPLVQSLRAGIRLDDLSRILSMGDPMAVERFYSLLTLESTRDDTAPRELRLRHQTAVAMSAAIALCDTGLDRCDDNDSRDFRVLQSCSDEDLCHMTRRQQLQSRLDRAMPVPPGKEAERKAMQDKMIATIKRQISERL